MILIKLPRLSEQMRRYFKKPLYFIAKTLYFYVVFAMECKNIVCFATWKQNGIMEYLNRKNYVTPTEYVAWQACCDAKGKELLRTGQKYYLSDVGLRTMLLGLRGGDLGRLLENIVYLHLIRSGHKVMVGKSGDKGIDFIRFKDGLVEYYQVALTVRDEQTLTREIAPLNSVKDHNPKFLLTMDPDPEISHNGIRQIYALDWLARQ